MKALTTFSFFFFFFAGLSTVTGQSFFFSDTSTVSGFPETPSIGMYDIGACTVTNAVPFSSIRFTDLAVHPSGDLYGFGYDIFTPGVNVMCRITWPGTSIFILEQYSQDSIVALTCDDSGLIYAAGKGLSTFDIISETFTYIGDFPGGMQAQGDLVHYGGTLLMSTVSGSLVAVDIADPINSTVLMDFPSGTPPIHGLAGYPVTCDSSVVYAVGVSGNDKKIYQIDFATQDLIEICDIDLFIEGVAGIGECEVPECEVFLDLDWDNSSGALSSDFRSDTVCASPVAIADADVFVSTDGDRIDSITLELGGIIDSGNEHLLLLNPPNLNILGSGTPSLKIVNGGSATFADFETALASVSYENSLPMPSYGTRVINIVAWSDTLYSEPAQSQIILGNNLESTLIELNNVSCYGSGDGSIQIQGTNGNAPYSFDWNNGEDGGLIENLAPDTYIVTIIDDGGCEIRDTFLINEPDTLVTTIEYDGPLALCSMTGILTAQPTGGVYPYDYLWSNSSTDSVNMGIGFGLHQLVVTDVNGCMDTASIAIISGDTVLVVEAQEICQGEGIQWQGTGFYTDTLACLSFTMANNCDSTICLELTVNPVPEVELESTGSLCSVVGEVVIGAGLHDSYIWSTGEDSPDITVNTAGTYSVEVGNSFGCTNESVIEILPSLDFIWESIAPVCLGDADGRIEVTDIIEGTAPYSYSIDGTIFTTSNLFDNLSAGDYTLSVLDASGCSSSVEIELVPAVEIVLDAGNDREIKLGESIQLSAFTNLSTPFVSWHPPEGLTSTDELSTLAQPTVTTLYFVEVIDSNGCTAEDDVLIGVAPESNVFMPDAFSPNGDGINDIFQFYTDSSVERVISMRIFNRWGGLVFERENFMPSNQGSGWNGGVKGKPAQPGVYVFVVEFARTDGNVEVLSGEINLLR